MQKNTNLIDVNEQREIRFFKNIQKNFKRMNTNYEITHTEQKILKGENDKIN